MAWPRRRWITSALASPFAGRMLGVGSVALAAAGLGEVIARQVHLTAPQWEAAGVWATFGVAVVAAGYAGQQARIAAADRRERQRPAVVVHLTTRRGEKGAVYLRVANVGQTTARNIRIRLIPALDHNDRIEQLLARFLGRSIGTMPAGDAIETLFCHLPPRDRSWPRVYTAFVDADDSRNRPQPTETFVLDLDLIGPLVHIGRKTEHDIAEGVDRLAKTLEKAVDRRGLHVITQSVDEMRREEDEAHAEWMAQIEEAENRRRESGTDRSDLDAFKANGDEV